MVRLIVVVLIFSLNVALFGSRGENGNKTVLRNVSAPWLTGYEVKNYTYYWTKVIFIYAQIYIIR